MGEIPYGLPPNATHMYAYHSADIILAWLNSISICILSSVFFWWSFFMAETWLATIWAKIYQVHYQTWKDLDICELHSCWF
jgi:hypothetical protein